MKRVWRFHLSIFAIWCGLFVSLCPAETAAVSKSAVINLTEISEGPPGEGRQLKFSHAPMPRPASVSEKFSESRSAEAAPGLTPFTTSTTLAPAPYAVTGFAAVEDTLQSVPPDTMGAVGPQYVVTMLNSDIQIQRRNGTVVSHVSPDKFWSALLPFQELTDPRILYDAAAGRWVAVVAADPEKEGSSLFVAVSKTGDPTGSWFLQRIDVGPRIWGDYPSIGLNKNWVVVTLNMYLQSRYQQTNVYVFNKAKLYASTVAAPTVFNRTFDIAPAVDYDNTSDIFYLVQARNPSVFVNLIQGPVGSETFTGKPIIDLPNDWSPLGGGILPQLGSTINIDAGDDRIQNCVLRKGSLWCAHTAFSLALGVGARSRSFVQWFQIDGSTLKLQQMGRIDDPSGVNNYAYPSIAVNKNGDALIGYSRFSAGQYASANYSMRLAGDPLNSLRSDTVFKLGESPYRKVSSENGRNRWGDFSATVVDPVDDIGFWTIQEYAASPVTISAQRIDRYGTWWAQMVPLSAGAAPCVYSLSQTGQSIIGVGGAGSIVVTATPACPWMAASNVSWINIQDGTPGIGRGTVKFSVAINDSITNPRSGTITVAEQTFTVTQSPSTALPDLTISALTAPGQALIGGQINVSATVRNNGGLRAPAFRVAFYVSSSAAASPVPPGAAFCDFDKGLEPATAGSCLSTVTVPLTLPPGPAYLAAVVDDQNLISEADESNNFRVADGGPVALSFDPARPSVTSAGVVNAASFLSGPVSPGLIVNILGSEVWPDSLTIGVPDAAGKLETIVAGMRILFDGVAAPLLYVSPDQVRAIVPYSVAGKKTTQIQVQYKGLLSNLVTLPVADSAPGIFTVSGGSGQAAFLNDDGSQNSAENPATPGSIVQFFGTGEGQTDPAGVDGQFTADVLATPLLSVTMRIGDREAAIIEVGAVHGEVAGSLQIKVRVPDGVNSGNAVPVVLTVGEASSQPGVTMAVKEVSTSRVNRPSR